MTQANRTLALLAGSTVVAIALGLYAYLGVQQKDDRDAKTKELNERLFALEKLDEKSVDGGYLKSELVKLTVAFKGELTELAREPGQSWRITAPVQAAVDKLAIDQLVSQLQAAKFKRVIEEKPDDAALVRYGLKPPQFVVTAQALVGEQQLKRTLKLEGGIENTFDGTVYLRREGEEQVWSAEGGVRWSLQKTTFDLRDKFFFGLDEPKVTGLEVKTKVNAFTLQRDEQKAWQLLEPLKVAADQTALTGIFGALKQERALSFPPDDAEARKHFEQPQLDATFTLEGSATVRLRMARVKDQTWVLREEGTQALLAEVPITAIGQLDRNPGDLKDKLVLGFKKELVAKIVFHQPDGKELVVERELGLDGGSHEAWKVTAPSKGPAKTFKIAAVLWTLGAVKANTFGEENPKDWSKFGLDAKAKSVALFGGDGKELAKLVIGKEVLGKPGNAYLRGTRNQVVEGDTARLTELPSVVEDLLDAPAAAPAVDAGTSPLEP